MSVVRFDEPPGAAAGASRREGFWQRLGQVLDAYLADRSRRAVPATVLRRSKHDIARCRRLVHRGSEIAAAANVGSRGFSGT
jgi:hypothetical protein